MCFGCLVNLPIFFYSMLYHMPRPFIRVLCLFHSRNTGNVARPIGLCKLLIKRHRMVNPKCKSIEHSINVSFNIHCANVSFALAIVQLWSCVRIFSLSGLFCCECESDFSSNYHGLHFCRQQQQTKNSSRWTKKKKLVRVAQSTEIHNFAIYIFVNWNPGYCKNHSFSIRRPLWRLAKLHALETAVSAVELI